MAEATPARLIAGHWGRERLGAAILEALQAAGKRLETLTIDDLAPADQFHGGGKAATVRLARLACLEPGMRVLDVGGGLGGPARTLAAEFGCRVTVVDLTPSYVEAGTLLTARLGLGDRVTHQVGDALELGLEAGAVDVVWTQNSGMNIADKARLYQGFHRVLRFGGVLALQEPMAGPGGPLVLPVMWAREPAQSFLRSPAEMEALIGAAGFRRRAWDDVTAETVPPPDGPVPPYSIQRLVMGEGLEEILLAQQRNREEQRVVMVQAVFERP